MQTGREQKAPAAEYVALSALKPWKRNPRRNKEAISAVARSIESFGFGAPIVARREDSRIIAGHTRYEAAKRLAMDTVPVRFLDVTEEQANALALADNKLGEIAEWDDDQLKMILAELRSHDAELPAIAGWSDKELAKLLDDAGPGGETTEDEVPLDKAEELREKWGTALGQLWVIPTKHGEHRILCGDSTKEESRMLLMRDERASLMVTDPPYGVDYSSVVASRGNQKKGGWSGIENDTLSTDDLQTLLAGSLEGCGALVAFVWHPPGNKRWAFWKALEGLGWRIAQEIVWVKNSLVFGRADYQWRHEPCIYAKKTGAGRQEDRTQTTVWEIKKTPRGDHPTQKPVEVFARAIRNHTHAGEIVHDPFGGSGTTAIAAEQLGRCAHLIELEPKYVAVALERLSALGLSPQLCPAS